MKKVIASASLVAVGALSLQAANAHGLTRMETAKPWSISASLRGFYDSNYNTAPKGLREDSLGFEVSPSASINLPLGQTFIGASYTYSMRYYEDRDRNRADHSHLFNAKLDHAFSQNHKLELNNSFIIAHEPQLQSTGAVFPFRTDGSYMRNRASAFFNAQLSELFGVRLGYQNSLYNYDQSGVGSRSARLDRMEHLGTVDLRWHVASPTVVVFGYQFGITDYTSDDALFAPGGVTASVRDNRTHYFYGGIDQQFSEQLNGSFRLGATHTDYRRGGHEWGPYADAALSYQYGPGSFLQTGVRHERIATDVIGGPGALALDQEATSLWASVTHQITAKLTGSLLGQFQHSEINGGGPGIDGESERFFIAGLNFAYRFNQHLAAEAGYNYDRLNSELARSYTRNRVYVGVRATF